MAPFIPTDRFSAADYAWGQHGLDDIITQVNGF